MQPQQKLQLFRIEYAQQDGEREDGDHHVGNQNGQKCNNGYDEYGKLYTASVGSAESQRRGVDDPFAGHRPGVFGTVEVRVRFGRGIAAVLAVAPVQHVVGVLFAGFGVFRTGRLRAKRQVFRGSTREGAL